MRQYRKKEILETADLLIEGNNYITNSCRTGNKEHIMEILSQSQEMAIILGNCLERFEEAGKDLVPILEDYCEKIYQFSQNLSDEFICRKIAKQTTRQLAGLKVNIIEQIPEDKIEMVFFPYKASMWDSLESVWRAAAEDPECDAYVVPIPYFERNQQGELAVMHYEGDQFPDDVPVVHYMDYNLVERKPDVAFIHNPYDQYNHVTSVHPAYYVRELKKYVRKVAYIPYFVSPEPNPDSIEVQKQKRGFVVEPGVTDTDLVFVQSEDMKRLYVNILEKEIPNVNRKYWEAKIFGLGSPKLDRVHSTKRNDDLLSNGWHSLIYNSNRIRKKVIFYNTSLHDLLNQDNMMEKITDTLAFFKEREDCVLWWRPHPLYESTLASMRPEMLPVYRKIVENYMEEGWGIFDAGEDLNWAIAETDAYYGDGSSVVQLYEEAKKPVLYQNTRVKNSVEEEVAIPIWPCAFCVDGDDIWFVHGKINALMHYNMRENHTYIVGTVPEEKMFREMLYSAVYKWNEKIYLIPCFARKLMVYNIKENKFTEILIQNIEKYSEKGLFERAYAKGKYLYCIPFLYEAIIKINMESEEIEYTVIGKMGDIYITDVAKIENNIAAINVHNNQLLFYNMDTSVLEIKKLDEDRKKIVAIASMGDSLYLFNKSSQSLIELNIKNMREREFHKIPYEAIKITTISSEFIMIDPTYDHEIKIINNRGEVIFETREMIENNKGSLYAIYYSGIDGLNSIDENVSFYFSRDKYVMYQFNKGKLECEFFMRLSADEINKLKNIFSEIMQLKMEENSLFKLEDWMNKLNKNQDSHSEKRVDCGEKILMKVKKTGI
jgi:hypothetical protein